MRFVHINDVYIMDNLQLGRVAGCVPKMGEWHGIGWNGWLFLEGKGRSTMKFAAWLDFPVRKPNGSKLINDLVARCHSCLKAQVEKIPWMSLGTRWVVDSLGICFLGSWFLFGMKSWVWLHHKLDVLRVWPSPIHIMLQMPKDPTGNGLYPQFFSPHEYEIH